MNCLNTVRTVTAQMGNNENRLGGLFSPIMLSRIHVAFLLWRLADISLQRADITYVGAISLHGPI